MSESLYRLGREAERMHEPEPPATEWWKPRGQQAEERPAPPDQQVELVRPNPWCSQ